MAEHSFIVPPLDGRLSGGTLYNRELLGSLASLGLAVRALEPGAARAALAANEPGFYWVDSLFLPHFPALRRENRGRHPLGLLAHYLPALVEQGDAVSPGRLSADESFALAQSDMVLAPSAYMKQTLLRLGLSPTARCFVVEPGCSILEAGAAPFAFDGVRALMIGNLTAGKGVEPFLRALAAELEPDDELELEIVGDTDADKSYAEACFAARALPALAERVTFTGSLAPELVAQRLRGSNLLISASRMESFGMAIAEARTLGLPVAALARGNVPALVEPGAGGLLAQTDQELARACVELARDPLAHESAARLASRQARAPRSFAQAARELVAQLSTSGLAARA